MQHLLLSSCMSHLLLVPSSRSLSNWMVSDKHGASRAWTLFGTSQFRRRAMRRYETQAFLFFLKPTRWTDKLDRSIMTRGIIESKDRWPRLMTARTAAAYCGERSPYSFRRAVGNLWPRPVKLPGKGERWLKEDLDLAIDRLASGKLQDAADVL